LAGEVAGGAVDSGGSADNVADGAGRGVVPGATAAGSPSPHIPWAIAPMAAMQETMTTRRETLGAAPVSSSYTVDV